MFGMDLCAYLIVRYAHKSPTQRGDGTQWGRVGISNRKEPAV